MILRRAKASLVLGLCSLALTFSIWGWIWTRPPGTFQDQGGFLISIFCFPLAMIGWLIFGLMGLIVAIANLMLDDPACAAGAVGVRDPRWTRWNVFGIVLSVVALFAAVGTLVTA